MASMLRMSPGSHMFLDLDWWIDGLYVGNTVQQARGCNGVQDQNVIFANLVNVEWISRENFVQLPCECGC